MKPTKFDAILSLVGPGLQQEIDGSFVYLSGQTPPADSEIDAKLSAMIAEWDAQEYARKRRLEYPTLEECVHAILDDELVSLQEKRSEVKAKFPKPE